MKRRKSYFKHKNFEVTPEEYVNKFSLKEITTDEINYSLFKEEEAMIYQKNRENQFLADLLNHHHKDIL